MGKRRKRATTEELVEKLRLFNHFDSADRMEWLANRVKELEAQLEEAHHEFDGMDITQPTDVEGQGRVPSLLTQTPSEVMDAIEEINEANPLHPQERFDKLDATGMMDRIAEIERTTKNPNHYKEATDGTPTD